nr:GntR family transcriptional regulator [Mammaliicoccus sp. Marseille-Q6498]
MLKNTHLYYQVYMMIKEKIVSGFYKEGDKLPSERKLCDEYDVSRITIREALEKLEADNLIQREHGRGSFVLGNQYNQKMNNLYSFKDEIEKNGDKAITKVINIHKVKPSLYLQEKMQLKSFQEVYELKRLRLANDRPLVYETSYLPIKYCEGLDQFDFNEVSLYETLNNQYQIQINHAYETLTAKLLTEEQAKYLDKNISAPCMFIERYSYVDDEIIEFTESVASGKDYRYTVDLI